MTIQLFASLPSFRTKPHQNPRQLTKHLRLREKTQEVERESGVVLNQHALRWMIGSTKASSNLKNTLRLWVFNRVFFVLCGLSQASCSRTCAHTLVWVKYHCWISKTGTNGIVHSVFSAPVRVWSLRFGVGSCLFSGYIYPSMYTKYTCIYSCWVAVNLH